MTSKHFFWLRIIFLKLQKIFLSFENPGEASGIFLEAIKLCFYSSKDRLQALKVFLGLKEFFQSFQNFSDP